MKDFYVTLHQFGIFTSKVGLEKYNAAHKIYTQVINEFDAKMDYWLQLKSRLKSGLSTTGLVDTLNGLYEEVNPDKRENYRLMIDGLRKLWGNRKFAPVKLTPKIWRSGHVKIKVSPQLCYSYRGKTYIVDLYLRKNERLDKRKADIMLEVMHSALHPDADVTLIVYDVARRKKFQYQEKVGDKMATIVRLEAKLLGDYLEEFDSKK